MTRSSRSSAGWASRASARQTGERRAIGVARREIEHGLAGAVARELAADLPMQRVLALRHRHLMLELQAGLVGACGLDAAEGRDRGAHQHRR